MRLLLVIAMLCSVCTLFSQQQPGTRDRYHYTIRKTDKPVFIDGLDEDEAWQNVAEIPQLMNHWPLDTGVAMRKA